MGSNERLAAARKRAEEAAAKVRQLEALEERKKARELYAFAKQRRLDETREKILLGALAQHLMKTSPREFGDKFRGSMNDFFTRPDDRALLGLPELKKEGS